MASSTGPAAAEHTISAQKLMPLKYALEEIKRLDNYCSKDDLASIGEKYSFYLHLNIIFTDNSHDNINNFFLLTNDAPLCRPTDDETYEKLFKDIFHFNSMLKYISLFDEAYMIKNNISGEASDESKLVDEIRQERRDWFWNVAKEKVEQQQQTAKSKHDFFKTILNINENENVSYDMASHADISLEIGLYSKDDEFVMKNYKIKSSGQELGPKSLGCEKLSNSFRLMYPRIVTKEDTNREKTYISAFSFSVFVKFVSKLDEYFCDYLFKVKKGVLPTIKNDNQIGIRFLFGVFLDFWRIFEILNDGFLNRKEDQIWFYECASVTPVNFNSKDLDLDKYNKQPVVTVVDMRKPSKDFCHSQLFIYDPSFGDHILQFYKYFKENAKKNKEEKTASTF